MQGKKFLVLLVSIALIAVFIGTAFLTGCSSTPAPTTTTTKDLKIGVLASLTGFFSGYDMAQADECQLVADMWNDKGGLTIGGQKYKIVLSVEDCKSTLDGYTAASNKMIFDQKISFLAGPSAFFGGAVNVVSTPNKVLVSMGYDTCDPAQLSKDTPYTFLGKSGTVEAGIAAASYMKELYPNVKSVVTLHPDDGAIPYVEPQYKKLLAAQGFNMIGSVIGYNNETVDFSPIVAKIMAANADAVFMVNGLAQHEGNMLKGLREAGWKKPFCVGGAAATAEVLNIAGTASGTDYFSQGIDPTQSSNPPAMQDIGKRMTAKFGADRAAAMHLETANGLWTMLYAIQQANSLDTTVVRDTWEKTKTFPGTLFGDGTLGGQQTYGINHVVATPLPYIRIIDGKLVFGKWITNIVSP
jgi:branched-chain amino acid transport system substrate-binding protein